MSIGGIEVEGREAVAAESVLDTTNVEGRSQWQLTWRRLRHDKMAIASVITILVTNTGSTANGGVNFVTETFTVAVAPIWPSSQSGCGGARPSLD